MICGGGLSFVSAIILVRLLAPSDFGLMAIAMAIISLSQQLIGTGFQSALIQKQEKPKDFLNTAWTFEFFILIFIGMVTYFTLAYFLDRCFNYGIYKLVKERIVVSK